MSRQLLNTSWTLHRLSPLHHGKEFHSLIDNPDALKTYADRLRDQLTGGVVSGLQIAPAASNADADDNALFKAGTLKGCTWEAISGWSFHSNNGNNSDEDDGDNNNGVLGVMIVLQYEFATYKAALLRQGEQKGDDEGSATTRGRRSRKGAGGGNNKTERRKQGSTYLPLLLTRLPNALRQTFISFLSANFDTYCTLLRLPSDFLCSGLETYLNASMVDPDADTSLYSTSSRSVLEDVIKDLHLTLAFSTSIAPALRTLNISIPRQNLVHFIGLENDITIDAASTDHNRTVGSYFLKGLYEYFEKHLAMKLDLMGSSSSSVSAADSAGAVHNQSLTSRHVRLAKIACGAFVLGTEGKLKLVYTSPDAPPAAGNGVEGRRRDSDRRILKACEDLLCSVIRKASISEK